MSTRVVLLTGGSGMVGQNLVDLCRARGIAILAPSSRELDLLSYDATLAYLRDKRPDFLVHAAGRVGGIQANIREPLRFLVDNLDMGRNLVMAARAVGLPRLLNLGSSCMYPRNSPDPLKEEDVLSGALEPTNEGYAIAKCAVARLCDYARSEEASHQYKTVIPCNLYGRYDKFDPAVSHLVAAVIAKIHLAKLRGEKTVEIWGDGEARREFLFAADLADAILYCLDHFDTMPANLNIGLGHDFSVLEYYQAVAEVVGYDGSFIFDLSKPAGMRRKLLDVGRQKAFGWQAATPLRDGIRQTYDYFLAVGEAR